MDYCEDKEDSVDIDYSEESDQAHALSESRVIIMRFIWAQMQVLLAHAYFHSKEFARAAQVLTGCTSMKTVFLRCYAKYLVCSHLSTVKPLTDSLLVKLSALLILYVGWRVGEGGCSWQKWVALTLIQFIFGCIDNEEKDLNQIVAPVRDRPQVSLTETDLYPYIVT